MVPRLVLDALRRTRHMYLFVIPLITLFWVISAHATFYAVDRRDFDPATLGLIGSMAFAYTFGPVSMVAVMSLRELRTLPVTNRDLWVATWLCSTMVITLALTVAQVIAIVGVSTSVGASAFSPEAILLTAIYCFAYTGALMPLMPALGYSLGHIEHRRPRWLWVSISIGIGLLFLGAFVLPYYLADFLPLAMDQLWWGPIVAVIGCLGVAGWSLAWTPRRGGIVRGTAVRQGQPRALPQHQRFVDRLTGIPRIAWPFMTALLTTCFATVVGFAAYWAVFESDNSLRSFLQDNAVLLFDTGFLSSPGLGEVWVVMACAYIAVSSPWRPFVRQLKVLPMTTTRTNVLILATPFTQWGLVWLVLMATHLAVVGQFPTRLLLDVLVFVSGFSALGQVVMIRHGQGRSLWIMMLLPPMKSVGRLLTERWSLSAEGSLITIGLVALAIAAYVNHRTLTRSTSSARVFQPDTLPFGMGPQGAQR